MDQIRLSILFGVGRMSGDLTGVYKIAMGYDKVDIKLIAVVRRKCLGTTTCSGW